MVKKRKKSTPIDWRCPRRIDKINKMVKNNEPISRKQVKTSILLDMLDELQKLDGEAYIRSAAAIIDVLDYVFTSD